MSKSKHEFKLQKEDADAPTPFTHTSFFLLSSKGQIHLDWVVVNTSTPTELSCQQTSAMCLGQKVPQNAPMV
jgi:hypothetical protein